MDKNGAEPISNTPEQFGAMIRSEVDPLRQGGEGRSASNWISQS